MTVSFNFKNKIPTKVDSETTCLTQILQKQQTFQSYKWLFFRLFIFSCSYLFHREHRSGPRQAKTARACLVRDVFEMSSRPPAPLKSWLTSPARGASQLAARARERWEGRETVTHAVSKEREGVWLWSGVNKPTLPDKIFIIKNMAFWKYHHKSNKTSKQIWMNIKLNL